MSTATMWGIILGLGLLGMAARKAVGKAAKNERVQGAAWALVKRMFK